VVKVTGSQGNWQLQIGGSPYRIKGLTYGPPQAAADGYMRDLHAMGVNTIRIWGVDDANTPTLLNRAAQQGLKVIVGHWLNQGADYVNDTAYMNSVPADVGGHGAVLAVRVVPAVGSSARSATRSSRRSA